MSRAGSSLLSFPLITAVLVVAALASGACAHFRKTENAAVLGAQTGAAGGAVVSKKAVSIARGAILGAGVGGAAGAHIRRLMDEQAGELEVQLPGAEIERVGEGIQVIFRSGHLDDSDSDAIRPQAAANLRNLASSLKKYRDTEVLIVGHTDALGTPGHNLELSARRARAASAYLSAQGVMPDRLRTSGRGEMEALATNETEAGRRMNRRIEVAIYTSPMVRIVSR